MTHTISFLKKKNGAHYAGASFEQSPPASALPPPPTEWLRKSALASLNDVHENTTPVAFIEEKCDRLRIPKAVKPKQFKPNKPRMLKYRFRQQGEETRNAPS